MMRLGLVLLLGGCAAVGSLPTRATVCVPTGMPAFVLWQPGPVEPTIYDDERGVPVFAVIRYYRIADRVVKVVWVDGLLATVDPAPDNPATGVWVDEGVVTVDGASRIRIDRASTCRWREVTPTPPVREQA